MRALFSGGQGLECGSCSKGYRKHKLQVSDNESAKRDAERVAYRQHKTNVKNVILSLFPF